MRLTYRGRAAEFDPVSLAFSRDTHTAWAGAATSLDPRLTPPVASSHAQPLRVFSKQIQSKDATYVFRHGSQLNRLVLNVANFCNLDCVYCYAQGGDYGGPHEKMPIDVGKAAFDRYFELYETISAVQFFGGEPLLNWTAIDQLCEYGWTRADALGRERPVFTMVTNGTVLTSEIIAMIRAYDIKVTVSLDGPPAITDRLRPMRSPNAEGTSRIVADNIRRLRQDTNQPAQIEGTYGRAHVVQRCTVTDILDYVANELGVSQIHLPLNSMGAAGEADPHAIRDEDFEWVSASYADAVAQSIQAVVERPVSKLCVLRSATDIVDALLAAQPDEEPFLCPAGNGTIAIDANGDVYPCFMFYRMPQFRMGSLLDGTPLDSDVRSAFLSHLLPATVPAVRDSWARRFFHGCAGGNYFKNGHHGIVSNREVELIEAMVSAAIVQLAYLREDEDKWTYLPSALNLLKMYVAAPDV